MTPERLKDLQSDIAYAEMRYAGAKIAVDNNWLWMDVAEEVPDLIKIVRELLEEICSKTK